MSIRSRPPRHPALRPLLRTLWVSNLGATQPEPARERVLPTGTMHLAFRLEGGPLRIYADDNDAEGTAIAAAVIGGPRAGAYLRDVSRPAHSVGVQLAPGAAPLLLGVPASGFSDRHLPLEDVWGAAAGDACDRLAAEPSSEGKLDLLESLLVRRLAAPQALPHFVEQALRRFEAGASVGTAVAGSGRSHRHFIERFHEAVGLKPQLYSRLLRFQRALRIRAAEPAASWAAVACAAGYSDQPHLNRDFRAFAGMSPGAYARLAPVSPNHLPLGAKVKSVQDAAARRQQDEAIVTERSAR